MLPFRNLVKKSSRLSWNQTLEKAFQESKQVIVKLIRQGISTFDINSVTCLAPDWSKDGMGFLLLQKHCLCAINRALVCCLEGWRLVFAGSRFRTDAEQRYAPLEDEAAAISWALEKCRMFILDCPNIIVVTDHELHKGLFGDQDLSKIHNLCLFQLKEKSLRYRFTMQHCPGKWHRASDVISSNPVTTVQSLLDIFPIEPFPKDTDESDETCAAMRLTALTSISQLDGYPAITSLDCIRFAGQKDIQYTLLGMTIDNDFPNSQATLPTIQEYWEVRNRLSNDNGLILLDRRTVIPTSQRKKILKSLHLANQGVVGMKMHANESVYWPGMNASICNYRDNSITCSRNAPNLPHELIYMTPPPEWPF